MLNTAVLELAEVLLLNGYEVSTITNVIRFSSASK